MYFDLSSVKTIIRKGNPGYHVFGYARTIKGFLLIQPDPEHIGIIRLGVLKQNLTCFCKEAVNFALCFLIYHHRRFLAIWADKPRSGAEKTANQGALSVYLTAIIAKIRTIVFGQRRMMLSFGFRWQSGHLFRSASYRTTAVMTSRNAFK